MLHEYWCPLCTERASYSRKFSDFICGNSKCNGFNKPLPADVECECCPTPSSKLQVKLDRVAAPLSIELGKLLKNL